MVNHTVVIDDGNGHSFKMQVSTPNSVGFYSLATGLGSRMGGKSPFHADLTGASKLGSTRGPVSSGNHDVDNATVIARAGLPVKVGVDGEFPGEWQVVDKGWIRFNSGSAIGRRNEFDAT